MAFALLSKLLKETMRQKFALILIAATLLASSSSWGFIPPPMKELSQIPPAIRPVEKKTIDNEVVGFIIPTSMGPTNSQDTINARIMDQAINSLVRGDWFRRTTLGPTIASIEKAAKPSVVLKSSGPDAVEHRFDFQYEPSQEVARLTYSGFLNSQITYFMQVDQFIVDTSTRLTNASSLGVSYITTLQNQALDKLTRVTYSINF